MKRMWRYIDEKGMSASSGLATDDYITRIHQDDKSKFGGILRLYNYADHCALIGRFQDLNAEIDIEYCQKNRIGFGRRQTGGGAIMMGEDQLGICFTSNQQHFSWEHIRELYSKLSEPIVRTLKDFGINAAFRSKNDLEVNRKKIAGLGVYVSPGGAFQFHASLLNDIDIPQMLKLLKIPIQKFSDKRKVQSVESRITSIQKEMGYKPKMWELKGKIRDSYASFFGVDFIEEQINAFEKQEIAELQSKRYENEEWLWQRSPQSDMNGMSLKKTSAGLLRTYIGLKGENIKSVLITGDFLDQEKEFKAIESRLKWSPLDKNHIEKIVNEVFDQSNLDSTIEIKPTEIVEAIWIASQRAIAEKKYTYNGSCYYPKLEKTHEK